MATHSNILAWKIPWTEEPGRLQSMGHKELDTTEATNPNTHTHTHTDDVQGEVTGLLIGHRSRGGCGLSMNNNPI